MKFLRLFGTAGLSLLICTSGYAQSQPPPAAAVEVTAAQLRELSPTVTATGVVQSRAGADIATAVEGQLQWIAEPGTFVVAGEVVARMQTDALRLQRTEQAARLTRSQVALKQAQRELERLQASGNAVSRFQLDQAQNTRDLAAADVQIYRATLSQTDERLSKAEIRAPFAGVIAERVHNAGEELTRGTPVVRLYNTEELEIRLFLPLRHVRAIRPGGIVQISVGDSYVPARVRAIVPVGDARSQSFEALIEAPQTAPALTVGHDVKVVLPLDAPRQALAVPRDAVVIRADGSAVYRINADQTAERVPVTTGVADGAWIAVTGALAEHDRVVVRGAETLHHGDPVQIVGSRPV
ncbi:efflux RND transporter periplasmic adaptor subunit [Sinimarinibacterium sp. CAU 1509]|uniref:efflux RND transporter periplasmic adaptor subunit n=1 Tax=Sinimarinibacterium sp. CAU 1509 TaxID=2562283 RepID=UPI00146D5578|nr:efflux RND transporter periplasmic adaptor subunit [Sinimarinibacterium sp. CAU 1509]